MKKAAFSLVLTLLVLSPVAIAEIGSRWMGLGEPVVYRTNAAYRYAPAPDQQLRRRGAVVTVGRDGLRGSEDWSAPADHRILFVGDSVTWEPPCARGRRPSSPRTAVATALGSPPIFWMIDGTIPSRCSISVTSRCSGRISA